MYLALNCAHELIARFDVIVVTDPNYEQGVSHL